MQTQNYEDLDYEQFLYPNREEGLSWTFLPDSEIKKQQAANPPTHKLLLVPADPNYSPSEDELWPAVHQAVLDSLVPHPEIQQTIQAAVRKVIDDHRGWRNPSPYTEKHKSGKQTRPSPWN
jgi:hypothetical protein